MPASPAARPLKDDRAHLAYFVDLEPPVGDFRADVIDGLSSRPKRLSPKYFYDTRGSELFDAICRTPEYYVTRTEMEILGRLGAELGRRVGPGAQVIEFGAGASVKVRKVLDALEAPREYVGIDIAGDFLKGALKPLAADYPSLRIGAVAADFTELAALPAAAAQDGGTRRLGFLPGSTIGNLAGGAAARFLSLAHRLLGPGGRLLIGADLKKDPARLTAAYNDAAGVTADFNRNILARMKSELGAQLDVEGFAHHAFYNAPAGRIEMHLKSLKSQDIVLGQRRFTFASGETIHTENSHKYTIDEFQALARGAGFEPERVWCDGEGLFSVHLLRAGTPAAANG